MKFVLGSRGSLGDVSPEELYTTEPAWVEPGVPTAPPTSPTSAAASGSFFGNLFSSLTQPGTVTATLNKYVFGQTAPIPTLTNTNLTPLPSPSLITGIPDSYLLIGGAAILFIAMSKKRR